MPWVASQVASCVGDQRDGGTAAQDASHSRANRFVSRPRTPHRQSAAECRSKGDNADVEWQRRSLMWPKATPWRGSTSLPGAVCRHQHKMPPSPVASRSPQNSRRGALTRPRFPSMMEMRRAEYCRPLHLAYPSHRSTPLPVSRIVRPKVSFALTFSPFPRGPPVGQAHSRRQHRMVRAFRPQPSERR